VILFRANSLHPLEPPTPGGPERSVTRQSRGVMSGTPWAQPILLTFC